MNPERYDNEPRCDNAPSLYYYNKESVFLWSSAVFAGSPAFTIVCGG